MLNPDLTCFERQQDIGYLEDQLDRAEEIIGKLRRSNQGLRKAIAGAHILLASVEDPGETVEKARLKLAGAIVQETDPIDLGEDGRGG